MITGHLDRSPPRRLYLHSGGAYLHKTTIVEKPAGAADGPSAFLVEQDAGTTVRTHYHVNHQFQAIVRGGGSLGRRAVRPYVVQYVAAHTGYGPIVAGDGGLWYLTLRKSSASGARYLPEQRAGLDASAPKRQVFSAPVEGDVPAPACVAAIAPQPDGLAAWLLRVPPGAALQAPRHEGGTGRYLVVTDGDGHDGDVAFEPLSIAWCDADEPAPALVAGPRGLSALLMQFPAGAY